jgi:hypothetical protein
VTYTVIELSPRFEEKRVFDIFNSAGKFIHTAWEAKFSDFFVEEGIAKARCSLSAFYHVTRLFPVLGQKNH